MDDLKWPRVVNEVLTKNWHSVKNTLVMKDFVDHLIQRRVITLDYWIGLKSKPITESDRTEDFLSLVMKFNRDKYVHFLEALLACGRSDLVRDLAITDEGQGRRIRRNKLFNSVETPVTINGTRGNQASEIERPLNTNRRRNASNSTSDNNQVSNSTNDKNGDGSGSGGSGDNGGSGGSGGNSDTPTQPPATDSEQAMSSDRVTSPIVARASSSEVTPQGLINVDKYSGIEQEPEMVQEVETEQSQSARIESGTGSQARRTKPVLQSSISKEEILEMREEIVRNKETELKKKEDSLKQRETDLEEKQNTLLKSRENTLTGTNSESGDSTTFASTSETERLLRVVKVMASHKEPTSTSTAHNRDVNNDVYNDVYNDDVNDHVKDQAVEDESDDRESPSHQGIDQQFVKVRDIHTIQTDIEDIKGELATDRSSREVLQQKMETQVGLAEDLSVRVQLLEEEKAAIEKRMGTEINKLASDLKNSNVKHGQSIKKVKEEISKKDSECERLKSEISELKKKSESLDGRVTVLEKGKMAYTKELLRYEKDVQRLQDLLKRKEYEMVELRKLLEETETERDDLMDEVADLKAEVSKLKAERKRLEQEKRTLLSRCVVPNWNQSSRRTSTLK